MCGWGDRYIMWVCVYGEGGGGGYGTDTGVETWARY